MKKCKLFALVLAVLMLGSVLAACGSTAPISSAAPASTPAVASTASTAASAASTSTAEKPFKVVYLVNGNLGDKGFYDNAAAGIYRLRDELGCEVKIIEMGRDETSYEGYFLDESEKDWDLIISGTWSVKELAEEICQQYPEQNYLFFDGAVDFEKVTTNNIMGVTYQSNETAFMAGALGALMLTKSEDTKIDASKNVLGFVGSMDAPNINDFLVGYIEGIKYVSPQTKMLTSYVGSFEDVPKCLEMTTQMYNQGAQIVYAPASQSILGAVQASADKDKYFIACDNDIWSMMEGSDAKMVGNVLSSSMKHIGDSIFNAVDGFIKGDYKMGENYTLGIKDGAVGLAQNANYTALVPEDIRKELDEIANKISDGSIKVGTAFGMETADVAKLRDDMKP